MIKNYQELKVWQKSMDLVEFTYSLMKLMPKDELFSLTNQMKRSAVSIASNIAEGQQRTSTREFIHFLSIARGSNAELETQFLICLRLRYLSDIQINEALKMCSEIGKMLNSLIRSICNSNNQQLTTDH